MELTQFARALSAKWATEKELKESYLYLEQRISERTIQLRRSEEMLRIEKENAESANTAKTQFLATISHELRTPMTGVLGMAELLKKGELSPQCLSGKKLIRKNRL